MTETIQATKSLMLMLFILLLNSCDDKVDKPQDKDMATLTFISFDYNTEEESKYTSYIDLMLYKGGVLHKTTNHNSKETNVISMAVSDVEDSKLYAISDENKMIDYALTKDANAESEMITMQTRALNIEAGEVIKPFYSGIKDLTAITNYNDIDVEMSRGVARLDLNLETDKTVHIESVKLLNVNINSFVYKQAETAGVIFEKGDFERIFTPTLNEDKEAIFHLFEQEADDSYLEINMLVQGNKQTLTEKIPASITRNTIYDITISGTTTNIVANITKREWEDGEDTNTSPELEFSKIDIENSALQKYIRISPTLDTLFIPSCNTPFVVAIDSKSEIKVESEGDIVVTPCITEGEFITTKYTITTTSRIQDKIAYLKIRNMNLDQYYGDKIVLVLEKSKITYTGKLLKHYNDGGNIDLGYADGDLGTLQIPLESILVGDTSKDWIKIEDSQSIVSNYTVKSITGGYRPNNMEQNGVVQEYLINITHNTGEMENIKIKRTENSLPVVKIKGQYWCEYNLRGNSRKVSDQILEKRENLYEFLKTCTDDQLVYYSGGVYKGTDLNGLELELVTTPATEEGLEPQKNFLFKNYTTSNSPGNQGSIKTCPDGYTIPNRSDMLNVVNNFNFPSSNVFYWEQQEVGVVARALTYKDHLFGNINIYYSKAVNEENKLVLYGLAIQNGDDLIDKSKGIYLFKDPAAESKILSWSLFNTNNQVREQTYSSYNTTRYIRCIKEPGFFIY